MATPYGQITTVVPRRGGLSIVTENYGDSEDHWVFGDRRSRQIAKRHWVRQSNKGSDSGGNYWHTFKKSPIGG